MKARRTKRQKKASCQAKFEGRRRETRKRCFCRVVSSDSSSKVRLLAADGCVLS